MFDSKFDTMKTILFVLLGLTLVSGACSARKNATKQTQKPPRELLVASIGKIPEKSDHVSIDTAYIDGNVLTLEVNYGGGCKDHTFQLIGSETIGKSLPPVRGVKLVHQANEDHCRAIVEKTLHFDVSALAYNQDAGAEIYLAIDGYKEKIKYTRIR